MEKDTAAAATAVLVHWVFLFLPRCSVRFFVSRQRRLLHSKPKKNDWKSKDKMECVNNLWFELANVYFDEVS